MKSEEIRDDRQMRSLTGLSLKQFAELAIEFEKDYQEDQRQRYTVGISKGTRQRRLGGGRKGKLPRVVDKLFLALNGNQGAMRIASKEWQQGFSTPADIVNEFEEA